jgi:pyrroline-5-carboxylate reductase
MKILFVGGGNMATALIGGLLQQGFGKSDFTVMDVSAEARERIAGALGVTTVAAIEEAAPADVVILAVKPQQLRAVAAALTGIANTTLVISIAAGIRTRDLSRWLGGHQRLVRAMPNTPALVRAGVTGLYATDGATHADRQAAERILGGVGAVCWFDFEDALDAVTAVSGSGPAYVFYFIEALEQAAVELGLDADAARTLTLETFVGAARLASGSEDAPALLRQKVTSKGGTTERALECMEAAGVRKAIVEAVKASAARARQLGDALGQD